MVGMFDSERDLEISRLLYQVRLWKPQSLLDVGAHWSSHYYARALADLVPLYEALDVLPDPDTASLVGAYHVGNVLEFNPPQKFDLVTCISSIEHSGITTYQVPDWKFERTEVFAKMATLGRRLFVTFPFGSEYLVAGQYASVTVDDLMKWGRLVRSVRVAFYWYEGAHRGSEFKQIGVEEASQVVYDPDRGNQCVAVLTAKMF